MMDERCGRPCEHPDIHHDPEGPDSCNTCGVEITEAANTGTTEAF